MSNSNSEVEDVSCNICKCKEAINRAMGLYGVDDRGIDNALCYMEPCKYRCSECDVCDINNKMCKVCEELHCTECFDTEGC